MIRRPPRSPLFPPPTLSRSPARVAWPAVLQPVAVGTKKLADYTHIVGRDLIEEIHALAEPLRGVRVDRKSTRLNSSHANISYAVFCLKKKKKTNTSANRNTI